MSLFRIRADYPKGVVLNRTLVIFIGSLIAFMVLLTLVSLFTNQKQSAAKHAFESTPSNQPSPVLDSLPKDYQDIARIRQFENAQLTLSQTLEQELNLLRMQTLQMQKELAALRSKNMPSSPAFAPAALDQNALDARKSGLFFASTSPSVDAMSQDNSPAKMNSGAADSYNQQNMQGQKVQFSQSMPVQGDVYNRYSMLKPVSPYQIMAGTIIPASLLTAIDTSLPGDIIAQVRKDIYDTVRGDYILIPKGSKVLGKYDSAVSYGQQRILIVFERVIRPDGTSIQFSNFNGGDELGSSGFTADVNNHWARVLGAATISTLLSIGAGVVADRNTGRNPYYPSAEQGAILGAAAGASQVGQLIVNRSISVQPTLTVPEGYNFDILVNKDIVLSPYTGEGE